MSVVADHQIRNRPITNSKLPDMEKKRTIMIEPDKWKLIIDFIAGLQIPIQQSLNGVNVIQAINSAKEVDAEVKETKK